MASSDGSSIDQPESQEPPRYKRTFDIQNPPIPNKPRLLLTPEEIQAIRECNHESFVYRCLPAIAVLVTATQAAFAKGFISKHPKYGAGPKVMGAAVLGMLLGKISYRKKCQEKILAAQQKVLADQDNAVMMTRDPPPVDPEETKVEYSVSEIFETKPAFEEGEPKPPYRYYSDIRRENRALYNQKLVEELQNTQNKATNQQPSTQQTPKEEEKSSPRTRQITNKYGDVWEE